MDELAKVVELIKVIQQTVEAQTQRIDQVFKTQNEQWASQEAKLDGLAAIFQQGIEETTVLNEALKKSLDESDQGLDDIADITAALLMLKTEQEQEKQQQQAATAQ